MFIGMESARRHLDRRPSGPSRRTRARSTRVLAVRAEPVGEHAAGRAGADDDVVELLVAVGRIDVALGDIDALQLRVVLDRGSPVLAPESGQLDAAEGQLDRRHVVVVDPAGAGLQPRDDAMRAREIVGEDAGREAELGVRSRAR